MMPGMRVRIHSRSVTPQDPADGKTGTVIVGDAAFVLKMGPFTNLVFLDSPVRDASGLWVYCSYYSADELEPLETPAG